MRTVCITGLGVSLPGCGTREDLWRQLRDGVSQLSRQPLGGRTVSMGRVNLPPAALDAVPPRFRARYSREISIYLASVFGARVDAALDLSVVDPERVGLFDGVSRSTSGWWHEVGRSIDPDDVPSQLLCGLPGLPVGIAASLLGIQGPTYTYNTTCVSGAVAIGQAVLNIAAGVIDLAIAGGHEVSLTPQLYDTYERAGLLSDIEEPTQAVTPWGASRANVFGEGAVSLVLESREHAEARGAEIIAEIGAVATGNSGGHPLAVDPSGERSASLMRQVMQLGAISDADVAFVVGHGNAVRVSDLSEENYMRRVFGARSGQVPLVSVKPIYGHTLGASSALNVAAAALMVRNDYVVPTLNSGRNAPDVNHMENGGEAQQCRHGLAVAYGMGGQHAVVLVSKEAA